MSKMCNIRTRVTLRTIMGQILTSVRWWPGPLPAPSVGCATLSVAENVYRWHWWHLHRS